MKDQDIYFPSANILEPKAGDLLISEPFLPDPNFERTVVLICDHSEAGTFGFVVNKPSLLKLGDVLEEIGDFDSLLHMGGPVQQDTVHFLHQMPVLIEDGVKVAEDIWWGGDFEQLLHQLKFGQLNPIHFRFFLGYSGWGGGQLEEELKENSWIIYRGVEPEHIFSVDPEHLWRHLLEQMGGKYKMFANYPVDPRLN